MPDIHPLAELFPSLEGDAFDALVADIKANGLHNCITLYDGKVLDGQNRLRACEAAGVEPLFDQYDGDDPLGFVMSMNVARRHLSVEQRSEVIRKLRELPQWREASNVAIAKLIGVSEATVRRAELSSSHDEDAPRDRHTITVKRGEQEYRMRVERKSEAEENTRPAPERPKPEPFQPADVMVRMRMDAQRLSGARLAELIAEWIMARVEVSVAIGSKPDVMTQLGGGVAARSSISKWVRDDDVLDAQRTSLVKETIAAMNPVERNKLIEELASGVASPVNRVRI
jgi:hypothetical protein